MSIYNESRERGTMLNQHHDELSASYKRYIKLNITICRSSGSSEQVTPGHQSVFKVTLCSLFLELPACASIQSYSLYDHIASLDLRSYVPTYHYFAMTHTRDRTSHSTNRAVTHSNFHATSRAALFQYNCITSKTR